MGVKDRILDTAARLFYEQGYQATGVNQIIEEASVAKASLYQHFRTKEELLVAYLKLAEKDWFEGLYQIAGQDKGPAGRILGLFDYRKQLVERKKFKGCAFVRLAYELPNIEGEAALLIRNYKQAVRAYIKNAVEQLDHKKSGDQKSRLTDTIYYLVEGSGIESSIYKSAQPITDAQKIVSALIN